MNRLSQNRSLIPIIIVTVLLFGVFWNLLSHAKRNLESVSVRLKEGKAFVLSPEMDTDSVSDILVLYGYVKANEDADFVANALRDKAKEKVIPNLYALQKRAYGQVSARVLDSCDRLSNAYQYSCEQLGQNDRFFGYQAVSGTTNTGCIRVKVEEKVSENSWKKRPCQGVRVRLVKHYRDSLNQPQTQPKGFEITDAQGFAVFHGLCRDSSYSVLPVKQGYEYGSPKGTIDGQWGKDNKDNELVFTFNQQEHKIQLLDNATLRRIKGEHTLMVRSPEAYKSTLTWCFVVVMAVWWLLCLIILLRKKPLNGMLMAACMFLTGLCVLMMFSMQDPVNDALIGVDMTKGVVFGVLMTIMFQWVDFVKFYQNNGIVGYDVFTEAVRWLFKPFRGKVARQAKVLKSNCNVARKILALFVVICVSPFILLDVLQLPRLYPFVEKLCSKLPKGIGWLVMALLLTAMLWTPFGRSVGGMRVNLDLFGLVFQPSEIAKYLIMLFVAAFFTRNADTIIAYSQPKRLNLIGSKLKTLLWIIVGLGLLMAMYCALGDMGPGLVIAVTFVILYSLIKSKVSLSDADEKTRWKRIFTCDFAMLIYGILSFAAFLVLGYFVANMLLFGLLWFVFWVALGYFVFRKQLFESALLLNMVVFVFVFGGQLLGSIPMLKNSSLVERFDDRTKMCTQTWGELDIEHLGEGADPVSNNQVVNGLWALATGGMTGQGMGEGKPAVIPAYHTDMILSSIGEQMGWIGLLLVVAAFVLLLRQMAVVGYKVGHPFAFYLCMGFSIITAVQFFIIALGSSGIIPLTGVTVPFLSYGRVSMILNLAAFGIVLSLSTQVKPEVQEETAHVRRSVEQYSYPVAIVTLSLLVIAVSVLAVWQYYQVWQRDNTLVRPVYVLNRQGVPVVDYNPRIALLTDQMPAGSIYDRNNVILATSDTTKINQDKETYRAMGVDFQRLDSMFKCNLKRYYPLGEQMFFMVGDRNPGFLFSYNENGPVGYLAEDQHLSYLRGFDNVQYDEMGQPVKVNLKSVKWKASTFLGVDSIKETQTLRDYRCLIPFLKDGLNGKELEKRNDDMKNGKYDLHLTVDAALQVDLQNRIAEYLEERFGNNANFHLMRASAVVLDAENGDLLASANYPLPDYARLRLEEGHIYVDSYRDADWNSYTDRDLGTAYLTPPGSTAKVMSAMAGLRKSIENGKETYYISAENTIERHKDGSPAEPVLNVNMWRALVSSSNCYFINLVNDKDLYPELDTIYTTVGVRIGGITPYYYYPRNDVSWKSDFDSLIESNREVALRKYRNFVDRGRRGKMNKGEWCWAWGHGYAHYELEASPLVMARVAATVVNNGEMPLVQYIMEDSLRREGNMRLLGTEEASILKEYLGAESKGRSALKNIEGLGGKTGTAERTIVKYGIDSEIEAEETNDCWYMCYYDTGSRRFALAVRIERAGGFAASSAAPLMSRAVEILKSRID